MPSLKIEQLKFVLFTVPVQWQMRGGITYFSPQLMVTFMVQGVDGFGAAPLYKRLTLKTALDLLDRFQPWLLSLRFSSIPQLREQLSVELVDRYNSVLYALDSALWDIQGKMAGLPVYQLLGRDICQREIQITQQLFMIEPGAAITNALALVKMGTRRLKLKVGDDPNRDLEVIRCIREATHGDLELCLDANRGYSFPDALAIGPEFVRLGVTLWEEPLHWQHWDELSQLRRSVPLPLMLDESVQSQRDVHDALEHRSMDILNLKLARVGGLTQALRLSTLCSESGVKVSVGCGEDLGPGMATIIHLSAVLETLVGTEGIGWQRLGFDCASPRPEMDGFGRICLRSEPGLGVQPDWAGLQKAAKNLGFGIWDMHYPTVGFWVETFKNLFYSRIRHFYNRHVAGIKK